MKLTLRVSSNGDYYQVIEELKCPFNEKEDFIILKGGQIIYWQNVNNYYRDMKLNLQMMKDYIIDTEITKWRNEERKQKTLKFLKETLGKMIAYERQIKIDEVLDKEPKDTLWLAC